MEIVDHTELLAEIPLLAGTRVIKGKVICGTYSKKGTLLKQGNIFKSICKMMLKISSRCCTCMHRKMGHMIRYGEKNKEKMERE